MQSGLGTRGSRSSLLALGLGASLVLALGLVACGPKRSPQPAQPPAPPRPPAEAEFFLRPSTGLPVQADPARLTRADQAFDDWLRGGAEASAAAVVTELLAVDPTFAPALVLEAQLALAAGKLEAATNGARRLVEQGPDYSAAWLVLGRSRELAGDVVQALDAYERVPTHEAAVRARERLAPLGVELLAQRLAVELGAEELKAAAATLRRLEALAPLALETWEGKRAVASATSDRRGELVAVSWLLRRAPERLELAERKGDLELEVGNPEAAIVTFQQLVEQHPEDATYGDKLARAKYQWRLVVLPPGVRGFTRQEPLTRAGVAVLLYWLVPEVRTARPQRVQIASDIVGHPQREEIARVVNLDLLQVDTTLHRFGPEASSTRAMALRALLRSLALRGRTRCPAALDALSTEALCQEAVACGLLPAEEGCVAGRAAVSGPEMVEWIRRGLALP
jgi:tetratricopeptide (TPR) repeat protein